DRLVGCGARPRVVGEDTVRGVTGLDLDVIAGGETEILGRTPEHLAEPVVLGASEVFDQTQQVQPAGGDGLAELVVGEPIELPQDDVALLIEKRGQDLLLGAGSWLGHRRSDPLRLSASTQGSLSTDVESYLTNRDRDGARTADADGRSAHSSDAE